MHCMSLGSSDIGLGMDRTGSGIGMYFKRKCAVYV